MGGTSWYHGYSLVYPAKLPNRSNQHIKRKQIEEQARKDLEHQHDVDGIMEYVYQHFRNACATLEETIERHDVELSEKEKKRLDKSIILMKMGFKLMKFVMKKRR